MVDAAWCKVRDGLASNSLYQYKIVGDWVMTNDTNIGSSFDAFLQEESILVEATVVAIERIVDWLHAEAIKNPGSDS